MDTPIDFSVITENDFGDREAPLELTAIELERMNTNAVAAGAIDLDAALSEVYRRQAENMLEVAEAANKEGLLIVSVNPEFVTPVIDIRCGYSIIRVKVKPETKEGGSDE